MAEAEEKKKVWTDYMCQKSETMDDIKETMSKWRKRDESKKEGDWVMLAPEPPKKKNQSEQMYCWIVHPDNPGKGGPEVMCHAARIALMHGLAFDIAPGEDWSKNSEYKTKELGKDVMEWPVLKFPNGKTSIYKKPEDSDDEEEEDYVKTYHGHVTICAVRYKDEVYTADTLTDLAGALHGRTKMIWTKDKQDLLQNMGIQASRHIKQMDETKLAEGLKQFKEIAKQNKQKI
jgi:hypothetical protein